MRKARRILVQKFGGTSVATPEAREIVCRRIAAAHESGYAVVAVISAMGRQGAPYATDTLLGLIQSVSPDGWTREKDLLFGCGEIIAGTLMTALLQQRGYRATYLTGAQAGIVTTNVHGDAQILQVEADRLRTRLDQGGIVVVAGGQGTTPEGELTTLGRGGSDTTACALGVALDAARIEIYTDVEGVMTADPRLIPEAELLPRISHQSCCLLAAHGAKVMQLRSVQTAAQKPTIPLWVRSTFSDHPGTRIGEPPTHARSAHQQPRPIAVAVRSGQTLFRIEALQESASELLAVVRKIGCTILPRAGQEPFLYLAAGNGTADQLATELAAWSIPAFRLDQLSEVSIIGEDLTSAPGFAVQFVEHIATADNQRPLITTIGPQVASTWVEAARARAVAQAVHQLVLQTGSKDRSSDLAQAISAAE